MIIDVEKLLLQNMVVFSRIDAKDVPQHDSDRYAAFNVRGTWRKTQTRAVDAAGNYAPQDVWKVHIPDSGQFVPYGNFVIDESERIAHGFVMPYEVTAGGFAIGNFLTTKGSALASYVANERYTLSKGDFIALGAFAAESGVTFAGTGYTMPYEVTEDGFTISEGRKTDAGEKSLPTLPRICTPRQMRDVVRKYGGFEVTHWRDLRRDGAVSAAGTVGAFASCIYLEG